MSLRDPIFINKGIYIRALAARGLSVPRLAAQIGCGFRHLYYVLDGERTPSAKLLEAIRDAVLAKDWAKATKSRAKVLSVYCAARRKSKEIEAQMPKILERIKAGESIRGIARDMGVEEQRMYRAVARARRRQVRGGR